MRISDWSSDVCSSDLQLELPDAPALLSGGPLLSGDQGSGTGLAQLGEIGLTAELLGPQDVGQPVEQAVHEGDLAAVIEGAGEVDVLRAHPPRPHFAAV